MQRGAIWNLFATVPLTRGLSLPRPFVLGALVFGSGLAIAGCAKTPGSFDDPDTSGTQITNLMAMVQMKKPPAASTPADLVVCPEIVILDGTADDRVYGKGDQTNENLRYQFSLNDVARDCKIEGNQISLRVGAAGKILLGPVGAPGRFVAPIRIAIVRESDQEPVVSKLYGVPVTVPPGSSEAPLTLVTEQLEIPYTHANAQHDYTIKVGFDAAGTDKKAAFASKGRHHGHHAGADSSSD
jgi:hypothetical protein